MSSSDPYFFSLIISVHLFEKKNYFMYIKIQQIVPFSTCVECKYQNGDALWGFWVLESLNAKINAKEERVQTLFCSTWNEKHTVIKAPPAKLQYEIFGV